METAIAARLYFVLFSSVAKSNNKLSPILPLQPATPVFCSPQSATAPSFPPPPPLSLRFPPLPGPRTLRSSFEFRAFRLSYVPRTTSVSEFESFAEIHPDLASPSRPSSVAARCSIALEAMEFLRSPADTTWKGTSCRTKSFDKHEKFKSTNQKYFA